MLTAANASDAQVFEFVERTPIATPVGQWANTEEQRALIDAQSREVAQLREELRAAEGTATVVPSTAARLARRLRGS